MVAVAVSTKFAGCIVVSVVSNVAMGGEVTVWLGVEEGATIFSSTEATGLVWFV